MVLWIIKINGHTFGLDCIHWESLSPTKLIKTRIYEIKQEMILCEVDHLY
jgi:hypothetical protein